MANQFLLIDSEKYENILCGLDSIKSMLFDICKLDIPNKPKSILSNDDLANLLHVSKGTLQNWRDKGLISYSKIGGTIMYQYSDIIDFLERHKNPSFL